MSAAQKLIQGEHSIQQLTAAIMAAGYHSLFLITGKHFHLADHPGLFNGLTLTHFIKKGTNVEEEEAQKAFKEFSADSGQPIVAIGGGSVMDLGKAVIHHCIESSITIPFFIAVPTTAGSGTEATSFAVVYRDKRKYSLSQPGLLPQWVVLDPTLTYSLSPYLTAVSGMDAFSQAVESYWNINADTESRQYATESILIWKEEFLMAVEKPTPESRKKMQKASYLAGGAINITRTTGPHALSYYLTIHHGILHGQAVALFLPIFFLYNKPGNELYDLLGVKNEQEASVMIRQTMKRAGLATHFSELGLNRDEILDPLLDEVNKERFANNPVAFDREKLKQLIREHL